MQTDDPLIQDAIAATKHIVAHLVAVVVVMQLGLAAAGVAV